MKTKVVLWVLLSILIFPIMTKYQFSNPSYRNQANGKSETDRHQAISIIVYFRTMYKGTKQISQRFCYKAQIYLP